MTGTEGMGTTPEYEVAVVLLSLVGTLLSIVYTVRVARAYRIWHDERAAVALAKGIGLLVMSGGLLISAIGLPLNASLLSITGLSISRGAFIVLMATLVLADVRPHGRSE